MLNRNLGGLVAACSLSLLASCGGTKHIGEITPPLVQRLSGAWTLNAQESDDPATIMERQGGRRGGGGDGSGGRGGVRGGRGGGGGMPPGGGGFPGGGMGGMGGRGGAGRMPAGGMGRPGGGGGRGNPDAMRAMRRIAMTTPTRLDMQLTDSAVVVTYAGRAQPFVLPFGKKVERKLTDDLKLEAKASWEDGRVVVERSIAAGGSIRETFMPSVDGKRLTVDVVTGGGPGGGFEFQRVYDRAG